MLLSPIPNIATLQRIFTIRPSDPYLVTKFQGEGRDKLREAIVEKTIEAVKVLELE